MTPCDRATTLFGRAWDDELSVAERETLEQHFALCPPCRREYDEYARALELVQALPRPVVADDFAARVLAEARRREAEHPARRRFAWPWAGDAAAAGAFPGFGAQPAFAIAAALVVVLGVSAFLWSRPTTKTSGAPAVAIEQRSGDPDTPSFGEGPATVSPSAGTTPGSTSPVSPSPGDLPARVAAAPSTPARGGEAPGATVGALAEATALDSLFDHTADVEFVLDPVNLTRERGRGYTPVPTTVRGEAASITF